LSIMKMKKRTLRLLAAFFVLAGILQSCTKGFIEMNTDPNGSEFAFPYQFMTNAVLNALSVNMNRNRGFNNELMQVTIAIGDSEGRVFRYDFSRTWSDYMWNEHYKTLTNFKEMYKQATNDFTYNKSYQGISLICQTWLYAILTDTYGDIPYSQSNLGLDSLILEPKFDKQQDIYMRLFHTLNSANTLLKSNESIEGTQDPVYGGDIAKWRKFGNSLFLRLLLRVSAKAEVQDYVLPKITEILETNKSNYPIMQSNDDSAVVRWTDEGYMVSPFKSARAQDFRAVAICSFFIDYLRDTNDPRINIPE